MVPLYIFNELFSQKLIHLLLTTAGTLNERSHPVKPVFQTGSETLLLLFAEQKASGSSVQCHLLVNLYFLMDGWLELSLSSVRILLFFFKVPTLLNKPSKKKNLPLCSFPLNTEEWTTSCE